MMKTACLLGAAMASVVTAVPMVPHATVEMSLSAQVDANFDVSMDALATVLRGVHGVKVDGSHRRLQAGGTTLNLYYQVACPADCTAVNAQMTNLVNDPAAGAAHAQVIIDAINAQGAAAGMGSVVLSAAAEVAATLSLPADVSITLPVPGGGGAMTAIAATDFALTGSAVLDGEVLSITQAGQNSQSGSAFASLDVSSADTINVNFDMYVGDGSGADGLCVNLGADNMGGRYGEDGVAVGFALCFDEWSNSANHGGHNDEAGDNGDHGVIMFQDGQNVFSDFGVCANRGACLPVSAFEDAAWHAIVLTILPSGDASFTLDSNVYGGAATIGLYVLPDPLFIGFSGRTGGATNNHWVRNVAIGNGAAAAAPTFSAVYLFSGNADDTAGTNHGTISGAVAGPDRFGTANEAYVFSGAESVTLPTPFGAGNEAFSIALWLSPSIIEDGSWHGFAGYQADSTRSPSLWVNFNGCDIGVCDAGDGMHWDTRTTQSGENVRYAGVVDDWFALNTYVHTVWTHAPGGMDTFYKNGAEVTSATIAAAAHVDLHDTYWIGRVDNFFSGTIDEVAFYAFEMASGDVAAIVAAAPSAGSSATYLFNGNSDDATGTNHGVVTGATLVQDRFGIFASAYAFDGDDVITAPTPFTAGNEDFSIALWLKPSIVDDGTWHGFCGYQQGTRSPSLWVNNNGNGMHWDTRTDQSGEAVRYTGVINDWFVVDTYVHTVWTAAAGASNTFYKNGAVTSDGVTTAAAHIDLHDSYTIGRVDNFFHGVIDEVAFYSFEMSAVDVFLLHAGSSVSTAVPGTVGSVSNVVTHSTRCDGGAGYAPKTFTVGEEYYCDRTYVMTAVPDFLNGIVQIVTSNSDKRSDPTDTEWICFDIDQAQTVYVLYDSRATDGSEPGWLVAGFADQHVEVAEHTDTNMGFFEVWYAEMPAGTVCTGGNDAPGIGSHYILLSGPTGVHGPTDSIARACEGATLAIECATGTTISVTAASYGRAHGAEVCPHSAVSNQDCHATNSADIVMAACQDQASCTVSVTNAVFGDPCGGTYKYLTVNYLCLASSTLAITNIATHSTRCDGGAGYAALDLNIGQTMYCDRDYVFTTVPTFLAGSTLITTSNSDKRSDPTDLEFLCFDTSGPATVYVLYDSRVTDGQEPAWMQSMMIGQHTAVAEVTDAGMGTMEVWVYYAEAAGTVCLGGNNAPGIGSNYLVAIGEPMVHADADLLLSSVSGYTYIGCFIDSADRDLEVRGATLDAATSNRALQCANSCLGYMYMGMQWTNECFCDNDYGGLGARDSDATCDTDGVVGAFPDYADLSGTNGPTGTEGSGPGWTNAVYSVDYSTAGR